MALVSPASRQCNYDAVCIKEIEKKGRNKYFVAVQVSKRL